MRSKTVVIVEKSEHGSVYASYCNDPNFEMKSPKKLRHQCKVAGIEFKEVKVGHMEECGCCGAYHEPDMAVTGVGADDCRNDDGRFYPID